MAINLNSLLAITTGLQALKSLPSKHFCSLMRANECPVVTKTSNRFNSLVRMNYRALVVIK